MKKIVKELVRNEKGQALAIVLALLAIGGLTIATLLTYMTGGLKAGQVYEKKTNEFYAADAGVENTLWQLTSGNLTVPAGDNVTLPPFTINNKTVSVAIANEGNSVHRITSTATSADGSRTSIEIYIESISLFDNAITSNGDVTIRSGSTVEGDIQYGGTLVNSGTITGDPTNEQYEKWPTSASLSAYYWEDVKDLSPYPSASLDIFNNPTIGPLYRNGDLEIDNTGDPATSVLQGTVYITGNLVFKQPGANKAYTIDLNNQTIYVEGNITFPALRVSIAGSGCIIAVGDVDFKPGIGSNPGDFVFLMSVEGTITFNPGGDFYGSVAGNVDINLQPGTSLIWQDSAGTGFNFPLEGAQTLVIRTWEID